MPDESRTDTTGNSAVSSGVTVIGKDAMRIGNYALRIENGRPVTLGKGGFGKTYLGTHIFLHKKAVIKVIHDIFSEDETIKERFFNEARALADLDHPHIARILDFGEDDSRLYYAMEYGDLGDLEKYILEKGPHSTAHVLDLALQAAEALGYTHTKGLLHRDIKPSNFVMCTKESAPDGKVLKVIDFGLVKRLGGEASFNLTQTGQALISLCFASPEQIQGAVLDVRSDIFSLGLTLWFMLSGRPLFAGQQPTTVAIERARPGATYRGRLPADLDPGVKEVLARMVDFEAENRPQTMAEVARLVRECLRNLAAGGALNSAAVLKPLETEFAIRRKLDDFRTPTYEALDLVSQTSTCLRWFGPGAPGGSSNETPLQKLVAQINTASPPYFLRPQRLIHFQDCTVIDEELGGDLTVQALAAASKGLPLADGLPLLMQLAQAVDSLTAFPGLEVDLQPGHLFIQFPLSSRNLLEKKNPLAKPVSVSSWPPFLLRIQPDYMIEGAGEDDGPSSGATINFGMDDLVAQAPVPKFGGILYYLLAARRAVIGRSASHVYVRLPALSEAGNDLLRLSLSGLSEHQTCEELLKALAAGENVALPQIEFPADLDTLKDHRATSSMGGSTSRQIMAGTSTGSSVIERPRPPVAPVTDQRPILPPPLPPLPPLPPKNLAEGATAVMEVLAVAPLVVEKPATLPPKPEEPRRPPPPPPPPPPPVPVAVTEVAPPVLPPIVPLQPGQSGDTERYDNVGTTGTLPPAPRGLTPLPPAPARAPKKQAGGMLVAVVVALLLGTLAAGGYWYLGSQKARKINAGGGEQLKDGPAQREDAERKIKDQKDKNRLAQAELDKQRAAKDKERLAKALADKEKAEKEFAEKKAKEEKDREMAMINSTPYKLLVSGERSPSGATVALDGKLVEEYNGTLPADARFPVKLLVTAAGCEPYERELSPDSGQRAVTLALPALARRTGTVQVSVPRGGCDYPTIQLTWVGSLADESGAPGPVEKPWAKLPGADSRLAEVVPIPNVPSGRYEAELTGGYPHLGNRPLHQVISVKAGGVTTVSDMPETLAGTYTSEFDFPVPAHGTHPAGNIHVVREIKLEPGLRAGSATETMKSGPNGVRGVEEHGKMRLFPATDTFTLADLKYDPASGIVGAMNPQSNRNGTFLTFTIAGPQVSFVIPSHLERGTQVLSVTHSSP